jgi:NAD(P)-dependent dehydrogenase (short-subunit alcohol dehydrogenase family)
VVVHEAPNARVADPAENPPGGRLQIGTVGGFKSEWWTTSNRNQRAASRWNTWADKSESAGEDAQIRKMFEVNVFGLTRMINAVLPDMRRRKKGFIVNLSSLAGLRGFPALGYYNATKFAVEGLSGALRKEVGPLGIKVMSVEPSGFRTDWAGRSANESQTIIADYTKTAGQARHHLRESSGKQPGDPVRAIEAIVQAVESATPPSHLLLGNDAYDGAMANLDALKKEFEAWEVVTRGADFPKASLSPAA